MATTPDNEILDLNKSPIHYDTDDEVREEETHIDLPNHNLDFLSVPNLNLYPNSQVKLISLSSIQLDYK
ncbi:hypothetical protein JCGZ_15400 [Jatropha curcas]|uniref:Uncharacterized protein n=1 Tax=Jatropha curcas TaxID=180498 RepID=A0A067LFM4_JATCU|nr:hypothetical protein JCGZ_15400 [Jatropha curcas]